MLVMARYLIDIYGNYSTVGNYVFKSACTVVK